MPECKVCGGIKFGYEDDVIICLDCHTISEDVRIREYEERETQESQPQPHIYSQVIKKKKVQEKAQTSHVKILTSWETFNLCLKGLVTQLRDLGATPVFEAVVFKMWMDFLQKSEAAFLSTKVKLPPKLPIKHWDSDAFLIYNTKKNNRLVLSENKKKVGGIKRKRRNSDEESLESPSDQSSVASSSRKTKFHGDFYKKNYSMEASDISVSVNDSTLLSSFVMEPTEPVSRPIQLVARRPSYNIPALKRKHLLAFLYLGCLATQQPIQLSDILRWVDEGHLYYHKLSNFFPPTLAVLNDLKVFFLEEKSNPTYSVVSQAAYDIARMLYVRVLPLPDVTSFIHKFCDEFNLPNQVALISQRLMRLLPPFNHDLQSHPMIVSWEVRAMAHMIVALKIVFGLDDTTEHQNSKVASQLNEVLSREGSSIELFVWDDWVTWSMLRSFALALYGKVTTKPPLNMGLCQNVEEMVNFWQTYIPCAATQDMRLKSETETMAEALTRLSADFCPSSSQQNFPACLTPLATYTNTVVTKLRSGEMPTRDDEAWNTLVKNIDGTSLLQDFRCRSIEYLLHPERFVDWAQQKGLAVGLRFGGGFQKCRETKKPEFTSFGKLSHMKFRVVLTNEEKKKFKKSKAVIAGSRSVFRAAVTRPDTTNGPLEPSKHLTEEVPQVCYGTGKNSGVRVPPAMAKAEADDLDKFLCVPSTEYWTHSDSENERPISFNYLVMIAAKYLYTSEKALLDEIALVESLHREFLGLKGSEPSRKSEW